MNDHNPFGEKVILKILLSMLYNLKLKPKILNFKLKDKDRQLIKDRFSVNQKLKFYHLSLKLILSKTLFILKGFNKEFDDIYETQKKYYIPSEQVELAQMIRQDNMVYIVTQYKRFYDIYSKVNFATNREKYLRYTPELLGARMREFFSAF